MQVNNKQMPQAADQQPPQGTEQTYAVTVDGQTLELTLEQLIAAAEQGLSRANDAAKNGQSEGLPTQMAGAMRGGQFAHPNVYQSFLSAYRTSTRRIFRRTCGTRPIVPVICWVHIVCMRFASCAKSWNSCAKMRITAEWMSVLPVRMEKTTSQIPPFSL